MGIKDLKLLIKKHCPGTITTIEYEELRNKTIAIDISIYLYKFKYGNNNFLLNFIKQIYKLKEFEITPIYVFDGIQKFGNKFYSSKEEYTIPGLSFTKTQRSKHLSRNI